MPEPEPDLTDREQELVVEATSPHDFQQADDPASKACVLCGMTPAMTIHQPYDPQQYPPWHIAVGGRVAFLRRATAADFAAADPVLPDAELVIEADTGRLLRGDGVRRYSQLPTFAQVEPEFLGQLP